MNRWLRREGVEVGIGGDRLARAEELAAACAIGAVERDEFAEVDQMEAMSGFEQLSLEMELAAAALDVGLHGASEAMPEQVRARLREIAKEYASGGVRSGASLPVASVSVRSSMLSADDVRTEGTANVIGRTHGTGLALWAGWLAAAACLAIAAFAWVGRGSGGGAGSVSLREALVQLQQGASDVREAVWDRGPDQTAANCSGRVVWSGTKQEGYMVFSGLKANDPSKEQYQLWVFDADRDARYPVDGALFDVAAESGEVIVKISPRLRVANVKMFVVTVEKPGGVWVSDRSRVATIAKIDG